MKALTLDINYMNFPKIKLPFLKDEILSLFEILKMRPNHIKKD